MTRIDFYTHATDKLQTACRLSAKAVSQGLRVMILTPDMETSRKLDRMLWHHPQTGFIPHCMANDPLAAETPVIIDEKGENLVHDEVLFNLKEDSPPFFSRFHRLVEIAEESESEKARERYRFYRDRGYEIHHHRLEK
ncbi:MAG TPA: DNA polymerase III subunit chi [Burkholderiales bacterium]|nr:DNA polymerase III subunit chi [Burkholderiales bacterium]